MINVQPKTSINAQVEEALINLKAAQEVVTKLFKVDVANNNVFVHTEYSWAEHGDSVYLSVGRDEYGGYDLDEEIVVMHEFKAGDYTMFYATEDAYQARVCRRWNNMSLYIVKTENEVEI